MPDESSEPDFMTFEVTRADRRFPRFQKEYPSPPQNRIHKLEDQPNEQELQGKLSLAISQRLPWHEVGNAAKPDRDALVAVYVASLKMLGQFHDDIHVVVQEACRANLEFRTDQTDTNAEARDAILDRQLEDMMSQAFAAWLPARNALTANLMSLSSDAIVSQLNASLSAEVTNFSRQFVELLERMVDLELFGLVEWLPKQCCRYHFFRQVVIQGPEESTDTFNVSFADDSDDSNESPVRRRRRQRRVTTTRTVKHEIRFARHQHELINAVRTSIRNSPVIMPPQIVRLVNAIPEWLYPFVEVIDGQIVRELIIERDVSVEDWTQVNVRDEPINDIDPGIIIGLFVLSGWGSFEIRKEQERRQAIQRLVTEETEFRLAPVFTVAAVGLSGIAVWFRYRTVLEGRKQWVVVLVTAFAAYSAWQASLSYAIRHRFAAPEYYAICMAGCTGAGLILAQWGVAPKLDSMSWVTPVALCAAATLCFHLGRLFR